MARVSFGPGGVRRYRGSVGNAVYRRRGRETILSGKPEASGREPTEAQRERFGTSFRGRNFLGGIFTTGSR